MIVTYAYTILYVKDVQKSIDFYTKIFGFEQKFITPEKDYAELISGATTLAFASLELGKSNLKNGFIESSNQQKTFGIELVFTCEDLEDLMQLAKKTGAIVLEDIKTKPWGQKVGYIRDVDGFLIEICTPMKN